ncbi:30S ribosomal protein S15 [Candidatus Peregrinibacteria bacterium]|nr:MAG: 30S ribosomal protein S15 [Candidatus Peregrinibacteria bacterium]
MTRAQKQAIITKYGKNENDTGSAKVQIAILTAEISHLTEHLREHKQDNSCRRGLIQKANDRRSLLNYFKRRTPSDYAGLIKELGIRK